MRGVTIQIASIPSREQQLKLTINSLYGQVEQINVFLNGYSYIPEFLNRRWINVKVLDNSTGDAAKFFGVERLRGYIFTCDDDIIYPSHYVRSTIKKLQGYNNKVIVTYHGKVFKNRPIKDFYTDPQIKHHYLDRVIRDEYVNIGGTGVMAWHSSAIKLKYSDFHLPNMADIHISRVAHKKKIGIICLNHLSNFFGHQETSSSIYETHLGGCKAQTKECNRFL